MLSSSPCGTALAQLSHFGHREFEGMQGDWLSQRVTLLEQRVERLETLPGEVHALRDDMNAQFAALRADMDAGFVSVRADMNAGLASVRADMDAGFVSVRADMDAGFVSVRADMDAGFVSVRADMDVRFDAVEQVLISLHTQLADQKTEIQAVGSRMLALHEEVISRIAAIGEGRH